MDAKVNWVLLGTLLLCGLWVRPAAAQTISTYAGTGADGFSGDGGQATAATLSYPQAVTADAAGNLYFTDQGGNVIRRITPAGIISTVVGTGVAGFGGDDGPASGASLAGVTGLAIDGSGNLFIADSGNFRVRRVDASTGVITTVAGSGYHNDVLSGIGGPATSAAFDVFDVAVDAAGNLFIAGWNFHRVFRVDGSTGIVTVFAGNGSYGYGGDGGPASDAVLAHPSSIATDGAGNVYVGDGTNYNVRRVDAITGVITTVAGNGTPSGGDGGPATAAGLSVADLAMDGANNLYIADSVNDRIRRVDAGTQTISTVAGNGVNGFAGDGGSATAASLAGPIGVAVDSQGKIFIADSGNQRIRRVAVTAPAYAYSEAVSGDLPSSLPLTQLFLVPGINTVSGSEYVTSPSGAFDVDSFAFTVPAGFKVASITYTYNFSTEPGALSLSRALALYTDNFAQFLTSTTLEFLFVQNPSIESTSPAPLFTAVLPLTAGTYYYGGGNGVGTEGGWTGTRSWNYTVSFDVVPDGNQVPVPTITADVQGVLGNNGWYRSNVDVSWLIVDNGSPVTLSTGCGPIAIVADTTGASLTCAATNGGGTGTGTTVVRRDTTAPTASVISTPVPNGNGWINANTVVHWTGADATSGISGCAADSILASEGTGQSVAPGTCTDNAGNVSAPVGISGLNIDKTPPLVTGSRTPLPGSSGWNTTPVTVTFTGVDALSGVPPGGCGAAQVLASDGAGQTASGSCVDRAGNVGTGSVGGIKIDRTGPIAVPVLTPAPNAAGWNKTNVTVSFSGTDGLNGSGVASCTPPLTRTVPTPNLQVPGHCNDVAGNVGSTVNATVRLDRTIPAIVALPPSGSGWPVGAALTMQVTCSDVLSGIAAGGCVSSIPNGTAIDTSSVGNQSYTVTATDVAGNTRTLNSTFAISPYNYDSPETIWTYAGNGIVGGALSDGGPAVSASLDYPNGLALDGAGTLYVADLNSQRVRKIDVNGIITTFAGDGTFGFGGDNGQATQAQLADPSVVAVDPGGNVYIGGDWAVRRVAAGGTITTYAGTDTFSDVFGGDGVPANTVGLGNVSALAVDAQGNLYIADAIQNRIRKVTTDGLITTVAGNGDPGDAGDGALATTVGMDGVAGLAVDSSGNLYVSQNSGKIRKIDTNGVLSTYAGAAGGYGYGGDGGPALAALFNYPSSLALDSTGNLYVSDSANQRIRKISAVSPNVISTVIGTGIAGYTGDGDLAMNAALDSPGGIVVDNAGRIYVTDQINARIRRANPPAATDTTPPTIQPDVVGELGAQGWYTSDVAISWTVTDAESSISAQSGCDPATVSLDTAGETFTCTATSDGGTASESVTIKRDTLAPVATATPAPLPNANGWSRTAVTVHFSGSDALSGVAGCSASEVIAADGANQSSASGTCTDNAGNVSAPVQATGVNIDRVAPLVSAARTPVAGTAGWNVVPVVVSFSGSDALSGLAPSACSAPITVSGEAAGQSATGSCTDLAGNTASATVSGISIDRTPPIATAVASPTPNANGWNQTDVTVSFSGTDSFSGSGIVSCSTPITIAAEGTGLSAAGVCGDVAGNTSAPAGVTVKIDKTRPGVTITSPSDQMNVIVGGTLTATYGCTDTLSNVASCVGPVANGAAVSTASAGTYSFTVSSTDTAGNVATATTQYSVNAPDLTVTPPPVGSPPVVVTDTDPTATVQAQLTIPGGVLPAVSTSVAIAVDVTPPTVPLPPGVVSQDSYFVSVEFNPQPTYPLGGAGLTLTVPLITARTAGTQMNLYSYDAQAGQLVAMLDSLGQPILGTVDAGGLSATFTGITHFSEVVALVPTAAVPAVAPVLSGTVGTGGWYTSAVNLTWSIHSTSPITSQTGCTARSVTADTSATGVTYTCSVKNATGTTTRSVTIKKDASGPATKATVTPAANLVGWRKANATVTFTGTDAQSGIASCSTATTLGQGKAQSASGQCRNGAGLVSTATATGINVDLTAPTVTLTSPANGAVYARNSVLTAQFACADPLSGIAACLGTVANGTRISTSTRGTRTFAVSSLDLAGNTSSKTVSYTVQ
jgi:hypothetical protein